MHDSGRQYKNTKKNPTPTPFQNKKNYFGKNRDWKGKDMDQMSSSTAGRAAVPRFTAECRMMRCTSTRDRIRAPTYVFMHFSASLAELRIAKGVVEVPRGKFPVLSPPRQMCWLYLFPLGNFFLRPSLSLSKWKQIIWIIFETFVHIFETCGQLRWWSSSHASSLTCILMVAINLLKLQHKISQTGVCAVSSWQWWLQLKSPSHSQIL